MSTPITITGNVTKDPALRYSNSGDPICGFSVAVNERRKNPSTGAWEDGETTFFEVSCFNTLAENVAESIPKGTRVVVTGTLRQRGWEGRDGVKRTSLEVRADEVGPSLRWATASIERTPRNGSGGYSSAPRQASAALTDEINDQFAPVGGGDDSPFG
jgi:single-strand DNA-binding protein